MAVGWLALGIALMLNSLLTFKGERTTALKGVLGGFGLFAILLGAASLCGLAVAFYCNKRKKMKKISKYT